jgi:hypothetical protein
MIKANNLFSQNLISPSNQLTIGDLLTLRILMNFNLIIFSAIFFLALTLIKIPFFESLGWVGYVTTTLLVIFVQLRFAKFWFAAFLSVTLILNSYQLLELILKV